MFYNTFLIISVIIYVCNSYGIVPKGIKSLPVSRANLFLQHRMSTLKLAAKRRTNISKFREINKDGLEDEDTGSKLRIEEQDDLNVNMIPSESILSESAYQPPQPQISQMKKEFSMSIDDQVAITTPK